MVGKNLFCINLDQPLLPGFRRFISSWFWQAAGQTLLVDPGPLSTIPHLLAGLRAQGVTQLDYILLTHIHIDHAGGTGELLKHFPHAQVICHPDGHRHLIEPASLWQGSLKVLGRMAEIYGEIIPVPAEKISYLEQIGTTGVRSYLTPGHAPHHCCFLAGDLLFAGEVAGVCNPVPQGIYIRPATPPRFFLEVALDSLQRMINLAPRRMVFAHYGLVDNALTHLHIAHQQLKLWVRGTLEVLPLPAADQHEAFYQWLLRHDQNFALIHQLPPDIQSREREFIRNTLRGMREYVANLGEQARQQLVA